MRTPPSGRTRKAEIASSGFLPGEPKLSDQRFPGLDEFRRDIEGIRRSTEWLYAYSVFGFIEYDPVVERRREPEFERVRPGENGVTPKIRKTIVEGAGPRCCLHT